MNSGNIKIMREVDNSGQVLLIVTVALAVLLGVGLSISSQNLSSVTRTSRTDSLQKVTAAAEGGLEKYLLYTDEQLSNLISRTDLVEKFDSSNTQALLDVEVYTAGSSNIILYPEVNPGQVATFYFSNNPSTQTFNGETTCLKISADNATPSYLLNAITLNPSRTAFVPSSTDATYDATTSNKFLMEKYIMKDGSMQSVPPTPCTGGYQFTNTAMVRIHPITDTLKNLKIEILDTTVPDLSKVVQGYKIISVGKFISSGDKSQRTINAFKFLDAPTYLFDYAAFID